MAFQTMSGIPKVTSTASFYSNTNPLLQGRGIGGFTQPSALFGNGEQGAWWDFSDFDSMYQDPANPVLKAVLEGTVGFVADKRVQTRGPEIITDPMLRTPAAWLQSAGGATATTTIGVGRIVINSDGSNVGVTCLNTALDATKYYEVQIFINSCSGIFGVDNNGTILGKIDSSNGNGLQKFIIKPQVNGVMGLKRQTAGVLDFAYLSVRELIGNHLVQPTAGARPTLSRRYNQLIRTEEFDNASWIKTDTVVTPNALMAPNGTLTADLLTEGSAGTAGTSQFNADSAASHKYRLWVQRNNTDWIRFRSLDSPATNGINFWVNLATGSAGSSQVVGTGSAPTITVTKTIDGWCLIETTVNTGATGALMQVMSAAADGSTARVANASYGVWGADVRLAADANLAIPAYQRVNAFTDYDTLGFPAYLLFDGATKWMQSASTVDLSGTNKITVLAATTKLSDAATQVLLEQTVDASVSPGFNLIDPTAAVYRARLTGTVSQTLDSVGATAPSTNIVSISGDISAPAEVLRTDGGNQISSTTSLGVGNFSNAIIYLGARAGASLFYSGRMFGAIIRSALTNDNDLQMTEKWLGSKCGKFF